MDEERMLGLFHALATIIGRMHGGLLAELTNEDEISNGAADALLTREQLFIRDLRLLLRERPWEATPESEIALMELVVQTASDTVRQRLA